MEERLNRLEIKLDTLINSVQSAFEKIDQNFESFDKRFDHINLKLLKLNVLIEKVDSLQGNSSSTIEILETGFNDIKSEIDKLSIFTRYDHETSFIKNLNSDQTN